jgi:hypothetical protein
MLNNTDRVIMMTQGDLQQDSHDSDPILPVNQFHNSIELA